MLSVAKSYLRLESAPLSFDTSLVNKCVLINNKPYMTRPTLIDLNPVEPNYYLFIISFGKCNGNFDGTFDAADDVSMKDCVPSDKMT